MLNPQIFGVVQRQVRRFSAICTRLQKTELNYSPILAKVEGIKTPQKGFTSIILILFILVAAGIGGWYLLNQSSFKSLIPTSTPTSTALATPAPDPTANRKTYTNVKYGYSLRYPDDWDVKEFPAVDNYLEITSFNPNKVIDRLSAVLVTVSSNPYEKESLGNEQFPTVKVGDFTARRETGGGLQGSADVHLRVVAPLGAKSIVFESSTGYEKIFDQILSTFKFVDQKQSLKPADSQTPASGICSDPTSDQIVKITFGADNVPSPRCTKVISNQKLEIINNSNQILKGTVGSQSINVVPGQKQTVAETFGSYLMTGVHNIVGAEIWLQ